MTHRSEEENSRWEQLQKNLDVMFSQINEMHTTQKQMKAQMDLRSAAMDEYAQEQHIIAQQVQHNGEAIVKITLRQMEQDAKGPIAHHQDPGPTFDEEGSTALDFEENASFHNVFAGEQKKEKAEQSKQ